MVIWDVERNENQARMLIMGLRFVGFQVIFERTTTFNCLVCTGYQNPNLRIGHMCGSSYSEEGNDLIMVINNEEVENLNKRVIVCYFNFLSKSVHLIFLGGIGLAGILDVHAGHDFPTIFLLALGGSFISYLLSSTLKVDGEMMKMLRTQLHTKHWKWL